MSESLYFIAVLPPREIQEEITKLKLEIAEKYGSKHALNAPPHITLHMPFRWKDKKIDKLVKVVRSLNDQIEPFNVELKDFDFFEPRVVFVDVVPSEKLNELQALVVDCCRKELKLDNANYKNRPFHPHVTIGFRDLKKPDFYLARKNLSQRDFSGKFQVSNVELLKYDSTSWKIF